MNEVLENVMIFINENTNILIGICLFLIFVLVCYLIDNSIKTKKAKKEFEKTKDQKSESNDIRNEIAIKSNELISENLETKFKEIVNNPKESIDETDEISISENLFNNTQRIDLPIDTDSEQLENNDEMFKEVVSNDSKDSSSDLINVINAIEKTEIKNDEIQVDEDSNVDVLYKNDKKLSEILFDDITKEEQTESADFESISKNIFNDDENNDIVPKAVESKVEIELDENELDNIMKKLKDMSGLDEDDNYTNIF